MQIADIVPAFRFESEHVCALLLMIAGAFNSGDMPITSIVLIGMATSGSRGSVTECGTRGIESLSRAARCVSRTTAAQCPVERAAVRALD